MEITRFRLYWKAILLSLLLLGAGADSLFGQKVNHRFPREPLLERMTSLAKLTGEMITFDAAATQNVMVQAVDARNFSVKQVLEQSLNQTGYAYQQNGNIITIYKNEKSAPAPKESASSTPQQSGSGGLKGRIVEAETSEPLIGATVRILKTERGTMTDLNGYYSFDNVPAGRHTIEVAYLGYTTQQVNVNISANRTAAHDVVLPVDSKLLDEVVVQGVRRERGSVPHATVGQVTQEIKELKVVASGISSEQISKSADRNAAQAVAKVAGVSIVDDKFVVVRGLNTRYNLTLLNDNLAPATEANSRAFALDLIPSRVIDKIVVYKTASPENQADATGGVVKVYTKDAKAVKHFDLDFQLGYRAGTAFNKNFLTYNGGKFDILGFDDGTRALPSVVPGYGSLVKADLKPSQYAEVFNPTLMYGKKTALPNMQLTLNYYDAWRLFGKTVSSLTSFSYKNDNQKQDIFKQEGTEHSTGGTDKMAWEDKSTNTVQLNLLQNFSVSLNDNNKLFFKNFLLQQGVDAVVDRISRATGIEHLNGEREKDISLTYSQRFLYAGNLGGDHKFVKERHLLQWNLGYNYSRQEIPDQRTIRFKGIAPDRTLGDAELMWWAKGYNPSGSEDLTTKDLELGIISRFWSENSEGVYSASLDYTFKPLTWLSVKTGMFHQWKKRELYRRIYTVGEGHIDPDRPFSDMYLDHHADANIYRFRWSDLPDVWSTDYLNDAYSGLRVWDRTQASDMYVGTEQNNSGYGMLILNPFKWIEISGGVRYEYNRQKIGAAIPKGSNSVPLSNPILVDNPQALWLPSLNLSLKPSDKWVLRAAYGKTVNRTEFREVSPYSELDFANNTIMRGNPGLVSAEVENYDLRLEFYPDINKGDAVSVGVFYKDILHPIERMNESNRVESQFPVISYRNASSAVVKGVEAELRKSLDFIPLALFRNLSVSANVSLIESLAKFDEKESEKDDIVPERPLQGQAPYLVNAGLYYENPGWGTKIGVIYNTSGESIYAAGNAYRYHSHINGPAFRGGLIELPRQLLDISYTQRIGKGLQMKLTVQNLLDEKVEIAEDFNFSNKYEPLHDPVEIETFWDPVAQREAVRYDYGDNIYSSFRPGRYFSLSISYSF